MSDYPGINVDNGRAGSNGALLCRDMPTTAKADMGRILVTGASGYIGGRLVPELIARGYRVRVMVRGNAELYEERWPNAEVVTADALNKESMTKALEGIHTAYYLIHSLLLGPKEFEEADLLAAANFRDSARHEDVKRIIYLGGMGDCETSRSPHLRSRMEVGATLRSGAVPVTTLRAAVIIGSGSASYEIIHHIVTKMRFLLVPHWAKNRCQPVGIRDVIRYLVAVLEIPETTAKSFGIAGKDVLTYEMMLKVFAEVVNKRIMFIPFPFSSISFYSYFASLITPVPVQILAALMEGLKDEPICEDDRIREYAPLEPLTYKEAIVRALTREEQDKVYTRGSDAYPRAHELAMKLHEVEGGPTFSASYSLDSGKDPSALFGYLHRLGGKRRSDKDWLWRIRGGIDRLLLGVGGARGRKTYSRLEVNDVVDFWRVEEIVDERRILLRSELKLPGKAWLEFSIDDRGDKRRLTINSHFWTRSILGRVYWYVFLPFHDVIFHDLLEHIEENS